MPRNGRHSDALAVAVAVAVADSAVVTLALPDILRDLHAGVGEVAGS